MLRIGLTGGMGAGKSTVARILADLGAVIVDSDVIAREVVAPGTEGLAALVAAFGSDILAADGSLDRPALAAKAFADDAARAKLNSITHPLVGKRTAELIGAAPAEAIVVQDIPLLVENGLAPLMNLVLVVDVPAETRIRRLVEFRGVAEADARARIAAQATDEQRRAVADVLLDNSGPEGAVEQVVRELWERRLVPFERNLRAATPAAPGTPELRVDAERQAQAQRLVARLAVAGGAAAARIEHVGPTAVPDLPARDLLELQIVVADAAAAIGLRDALGAAGFPAMSGEGSGALRAAAWYGSADPGRPAVVAVRVEGTPEQRFASALGERLRADAALREEYLDVARKAEAEAAGSAGAAAGAAFDAVLHPWLSEVAERLLGTV
ncbi:dephospho-CoA kinase [Nocardia farcinica]|uniref:dephospho-CoA kinase n=1 Tax=Nocardia farcinica TaxID=37329 RepID=UPI0018932DA1|nr:dephospho-CoA kinase [Nocardia farcinica]MBF6520368.1 dephospho-CoA kinase [Nocardia farcinica]